MNRKIVFKENDKVIKTIEIKERNEDHIDACRKYPSQVFKKKKGKGSYTRKNKHKDNSSCNIT